MMRKRLVVLLLAAAVIVALIRILGPPKTGKLSESAATAAGSSAKPRRWLPHLESPSAAPNDGKGPLVPEETPGRTVFSAKWGSGPNELGRERPEEGNPMGPMSVAVDGRGRINVLDSVNGRIVRRGQDGKVDTTFRADLMAAQDLAVGADGSTAVLDRFADKQVIVYDESGKVKADLLLQGDGVEDVGSVTGVFVDGTDVYVEREHGPLVKIGDTSGQPADPRTEIPGRPSRDGLSFLNCGIIDAQAGRVYVSAIDRATNQHRFTRELKLKSFVRQIVLLDSDLNGIIYFAAEVEMSGGDDMVLLTCMEPLKGVPIGGAVLPVNTMPEETFRDLAVLDEGGVIYAVRTESGVTYTRYDCE